MTPERKDEFGFAEPDDALTVEHRRDAHGARVIARDGDELARVEGEIDERLVKGVVVSVVVEVVGVDVGDERDGRVVQQE